MNTGLPISDAARAIAYVATNVATALPLPCSGSNRLTMRVLAVDDEKKSTSFVRKFLRRRDSRWTCFTMATRRSRRWRTRPSM